MDLDVFFFSERIKVFSLFPKILAGITQGMQNFKLSQALLRTSLFPKTSRVKAMKSYRSSCESNCFPFAAHSTI